MRDTLIEPKPSHPRESDLLATQGLPVGGAKAPYVRGRKLGRSIGSGSGSAATRLYRFFLALFDPDID